MIDRHAMRALTAARTATAIAAVVAVAACDSDPSSAGDADTADTAPTETAAGDTTSTATSQPDGAGGDTTPPGDATLPGDATDPPSVQYAGPCTSVDTSTFGGETSTTTTIRTYDAEGRLTRRAVDGGREDTLTWGAHGGITGLVVGPSGEAPSASLSWTWEQSEGVWLVTSWTYAELENTKTWEIEGGHPVAFDETTFSGGATYPRTWVWSPEGRLMVVNRFAQDGTTVASRDEYSYASGRLTERVASSLEGDELVPRTSTWGYDGSGNLISWYNASSSVPQHTWDVDGQGRFTAHYVEGDLQASVAYSGDGGTLTGTSDGCEIRFRGRYATVQTPARQNPTFRIDAFGWPEAGSYPLVEGPKAEWELAGVVLEDGCTRSDGTTTYTYDEAGNVLTSAFVSDDGTSSQDVVYGYDCWE